MTDTTTTVDDVIVVGNRRPARTSAPFGGGSGVGGGKGWDPIEQREIDEEPEDDGSDDPCRTPERRKEKNADAVAAAAVALFAEMAALQGEDGLNYRERGAYLFLNPDGTVSLGPVKEGDPFVSGGVGSTGDLSYGGRDPAMIIGSVHTHSVGNFLPSTAPNGGGDRGHLHSMVATVNAAGGNGADVRIYIAAQTTPPADVDAYNAIHYYDADTIEGDIQANQPSIEVDPNGQACP